MSPDKLRDTNGGAGIATCEVGLELPDAHIVQFRPCSSGCHACCHLASLRVQVTSFQYVVGPIPAGDRAERVAASRASLGKQEKK